MQLKKYELLKKGIYVDEIKHLARIKNLIKKLYPIRCEHQLIRFGSSYDGGYLVPDDLEGINICFSPGVDVNASFETDILNKRGIASHLADFSVDGPPANFNPASFTKKYLGCVNDEKFITLDNWVRSQKSIHSQEDFMLQMDIEGGEYLSILGVSEEVLKKFRIIVVEIHHVEAWSQKLFFEIVESFFEKLLKYFYVIHNHPNNFPGIVNIGGIEAPRVFELTLIRKDRVNQITYCSDFPHPLDSPNVLSKPSITLPKNWYFNKNSTQDEHKKYLLCRPRGGLNDIFTQIERCWRYAEKFNRVLIIDTRNSEGLKNNFNTFFEIKDKHSAITFIDDKSINTLDRMDTFPAIIGNQLDNYISSWHKELRACVKEGSETPLSFNFQKDYIESLLVHEDFGGTINNELISLDCLKRLKFSSDFSNDISNRLNVINNLNYTAIHIRHTDYETDYKAFFSHVYSETVGKNLLICTDNLQVFKEAALFFKESKVFNLGEMIDTRSAPRHKFKTTKGVSYTLTVEAMSDLIALSLAEKLFFPKLLNNGKFLVAGILGGYSGFALLAQSLSKNRTVIQDLIKR